MKLLTSQHIDKRKWDQMVASDEQLDFFSLSWVQDILHKDWEMLCDEEGNYLLNIPKGSKLGFSYRLQPFFIRSLHVSSKHQGDLKEIVQFLKESASYVQLNVDSENQDLFHSFGKFQLLNLSSDLEGIKANYATNAKRILKKIPADFILGESTDVSEFISFSDMMSPLGNADASACADYCVTLFSDLTRYVTMQNLFHDGGFSNTGVTQQVIDRFSEE